MCITKPHQTAPRRRRATEHPRPALRPSFPSLNVTHSLPLVLASSRPLVVASSLPHRLSSSLSPLVYNPARRLQRSLLSFPFLSFPFLSSALRFLPSPPLLVSLHRGLWTSDCGLWTVDFGHWALGIGHFGFARAVARWSVGPPHPPRPHPFYPSSHPPVLPCPPVPPPSSRPPVLPPLLAVQRSTFNVRSLYPHPSSFIRVSCRARMVSPAVPSFLPPRLELCSDFRSIDVYDHRSPDIRFPRPRVRVAIAEY
ncbi:hypothetical protein C8Q80DRAFT_330682 [Daedaleopsis nitida]|nr:hypothetical protein C8Q80DRAFT_330682 [Daedaleopsis nitida]